MARVYNPVDSRQLSVFIELARSRNMGQAGRALNLTTSAISYSIRRLEDDLGCKLFEREARRLSLTDAGRRLVGVAEDMLEQLTETRQIIKSWGVHTQKSLCIGASYSACQYIIPVALREFKESFPEVNVHIVSGNSYELPKRFDDAGIDVAIYPSAGLNGQQKEISIGTDELKFIVNSMHSWAQGTRFTLKDFERQRVILTESNSYTYDLVNEYFRSYRVSLLPFIEISNEEVIKRLVELDIGIGLLPEWIIAREIQAGTLLPLSPGGRKLRRNWVVAHQARKKLSFAESLFVGIVRNVARNLFEGHSV